MCNCMKVRSGTSDKAVTLREKLCHLIISTNAVHNSHLSAGLFNECNKVSVCHSMIALGTEIYQSFDANSANVENMVSS